MTISLRRPKENGENVQSTQQRMLEVLSVMHAPTPAAKLLEALQALSLGGLLAVADVKRHLNELKERGLLLEKATRYWLASTVREETTRRSAEHGLLPRVAAYVATLPRRPFSNYHCRPEGGYADPDEVGRDLRLAVYQQDVPSFANLLILFSRFFQYSIDEVHPLYLMATEPFEPHWLSRLPAPILDAMADKVLYKPVTPATQRFADWWVSRTLRGETSPEQDRHREPLARWWIDLCRFSEADQLLAPLTTPGARACQGAMAALRGQWDQATTFYERGMASVKTKGRSDFLDSPLATLYPLVLVAAGRPDDATRVVDRALSAKALGPWSVVALALRLARGEVLSSVGLPPLEGAPGLAELLRACLLYWCKPESVMTKAASLRECVRQAESQGWTWLAADFADILKRGGDTTVREKAAELRQAAGTRCLLDTVQVREAWDRALSALEQHFDKEKQVTPEVPDSDFRLVWTVRVGTATGWACSELAAREQKRTSTGWTGGRPVAMKRLYAEWSSLGYLTDVDRRLCAAIQRSVAIVRGYPQESFTIPMAEGLKYLAGHPHLYRVDDPTTRVCVDTGRPVLKVENVPKGARLALDPPATSATHSLVRLAGPNHLRVIDFNDSDRGLASVIGAGLTLPSQAEDRLKHILSKAAKAMTVQSDLSSVDSRQVAADSRLHLKLVPAGLGLSGQVCIHPLGLAGPALPPCDGAVRVLAFVDGHGLETTRDLKRERANWRRLCEVAPVVAPRTWSTGDPAACLEFLAAVETLGETVVLHWPQGVSYRIVRTVDWSQVRINVSQLRDMLEVGGDVAVDREQVARLSDMLGPSRVGRFVPLGKGQFLALTAEFERRLAALEGLAIPGHKGLQVHRVTLPLLCEVLDGAEVQTTSEVATSLERLQQWVPPGVPADLQTELRDYQVDGYRWLCRLAEWGVGACLADDMGLGKTIQVLALLLQRSAGGPALVVAPTSVCPNWLSEATRFAPSLSVRLWGQERHLDGLGPRQVVVTSYSLLVQSLDRLAEQEWHTVVLDEAQAIKNASTQRFQATVALQARFRVAVSGTPVENHLSEIWSILCFLNPGLLGSRKQFDTRFDSGAREALASLRQLLSAFVLRRTKAQVLSELPARTEITLSVELSQSERALYEALRRQAMAELDSAPQRMQVLAHLMRLRRACCHPWMVTGDASQVSALSSKLETLEPLLEDLRENKHRALVFSQFVDHLEAVRVYLEGRGVSYQYLDGSTPMAEREKRVAAFQAGQGEVFLISLRAGGTGLNLTAADYVVHLDPWWNPAVEDQASDRAHRIGQQRPVTIYRLVAKDTVEERIVELHGRKRDLATEIVGEAEGTTALSVEQLVALLRQASVDTIFD